MHAELVDQAKRGDREAFDALARLTGDRCMAIAFRILRDFDLADDAVQSALLTAWREIRALRDPALRALAPPDPDQCLLRRGQASPALVGRDPAPARRARARARRVPDRRTPGPARARLPAAHRRAARRPGLPPLPRALHCARWRIASVSPSGPSSPACITPSGRSEPASRLTLGRRRVPGANGMTAHHDLDRELTPSSGGPDRAARPVVRRGPRSHRTDTTAGRHRPVEGSRHEQVRNLSASARPPWSYSSSSDPNFSVRPAACSALAPTPTPTPEATLESTPEPTATPEPSAPPLTQSFTSTLHGIPCRTPKDGPLRRRPSPGPIRFPTLSGPLADLLHDPTLRDHLFLAIASQPIGDSTPEDWVAEQLASDEDARQPSRSPWTAPPG